MKKIEPARKNYTGDLLQNVRDFWSRNVNAERLYGKQVSKHGRGTSGYFYDIETQRYRSHRHLLPWIESMHPGKTILEIGCGVGLDAFRIAHQGLHITATDLTEIGVTTARDRFKAEGVSGTFFVSDAANLPLADNYYDYIYSFGVLHHAPDTESCINEVYRVLKPGGEARIMLYHRHSLNELVHRLTGVPFEEKDELCPVVRRYTKSEIRSIFGAFSFLNIRTEYVYGEGYGLIFRYTPAFLYKLMSRYIGWHLMITAVK